MKWMRRRRPFKRCPRRRDCVSPEGHYGPCQVWDGSRHVFINDDGSPWEPPKKGEPSKRSTEFDPDDPTTW